MKHEFTQTVYYADTDAYGVVWHGSYLRWMEAARCCWCEVAGIDLIDLEKNHNIVIPVTGLNMRYKCSARLGDIAIIETTLEKYNGLSAVFKQVIMSAPDGKVFVEAQVETVAISADSGKLYRRMPPVLAQRFEVIKCD